MLDLLTRLADVLEAEERNALSLIGNPGSYIPSVDLTEARRAIAEMRVIEVAEEVYLVNGEIQDIENHALLDIMFFDTAERVTEATKDIKDGVQVSVAVIVRVGGG